VKLSFRVKRLAVLGLTLFITAYLFYRVYSEASEIHISPWDILSVYTAVAVALGVLGYLVYTAAWYIYLRGVSNADFRRVLLANLSGTYLAFSLSTAVGTLVKVKFIKAGYFQVLATTLMEISTEFLTGFAMVFVLTGNPLALAVVVLIALAFVADTHVYRLLSGVFERLGRGSDSFREFYLGWHAAKSDPKRVAVGMLLGSLLVLINAAMLGSVAMIFGVRIGFVSLLKAILYSEFLGGALGTPGGLGGNELGILMAIGRSGLSVVIAFFFKFLNQYSFAIVGAAAFYRLVMREVGTGKDL